MEHIESILLKLFRSSNSNSFKALIVLDNIHDFGHDRKSSSGQPDFLTHEMDKYCDPRHYNGKYSCIFVLLLDTLNKYTYKAIGVTDMFTPPFFVTGWETKFRDLLLKAGDILIPVKREDFWNTVYILPCISKDYPISKATSISKEFKTKIGARHDYLTTAHFDGCGGTCTTFDNVTDPTTEHVPPNFIFNIPTTIGDVLYSYKNTERSLERKFPKKYGKGTSYNIEPNNRKRCICTIGDGTKDCINDGGVDKCFYDRVDKIRNDSYSMDSNIQDTVQDTAKNLYKYLDHKHEQDPLWMATYSDIEFFVTLKALGDLAQLVEAKIRNCYLFTGDKIQFILGAKMGAMVIDTVTKPYVKIYFSKLGALQYVNYLGTALRKVGVDIEGKSVKEMKSISKTMSEYTGHCLQSVLKLLIYFALNMGFYYTSKSKKLHRD
jgi:hypothetical protein